MTKLRRLLRLPRVLDATGLQKSQLYEAIDQGRFKKPVKILEGGRAVGWPEDEVAAYNESRIAARDAAAELTKEPEPASAPKGTKRSKARRVGHVRLHPIRGHQ